MIYVRRSRPKLNFNIPLSENTTLYFGANRKIGPYAGINHRPTKRLKINPRINARYGPSANASYRINRRVTATAGVTPTNARANINAKISRNTSASVGVDNTGTYGQLRHKRYIIRKQIRQ
ncbi:MAG: hypothetical protein ACP5N3_02765 [Candidatus Nanoarchaeia archaeon]